MKALITLLSLATFSVGAFAYDHAQAQQFDKFYSHVTQKALSESKLSISGDTVMKMLREKKDFILLDVRTKGEMSVLSLVTDNTVQIPIDELFQEKNLDKLPTDKPIVVVCHSGARALLAAMNLKQIGFKNIQLLQGGIGSLAIANSVKNAPMK